MGGETLMSVTYDVFSEIVGTISRHKSLEEAVKSATKLANKNMIHFTIFKNHATPPHSQKLVKWVFPKKR